MTHWEKKRERKRERERERKREISWLESMPGPTLELDSLQVPLLLLVKETMEGKRRARKDEL